MEYFMQLFGNITIEKATLTIGAIVFLLGCYKKISGYFTKKAIRDKEKDDRLQEVIKQSEQYPGWHKQSIEIRDQINISTQELNKKLDMVCEKMTEEEKRREEEHATANRYRILRFDDEIRHDEHHTKEHFDQILEDITEYENYCDSHPLYKNNKATLAIENIKHVYQRCTDEKKFL